MILTETDIANMALDLVTATNINSIDDNSTQAKVCKRHYYVLRDSLIQESQWTFARAEVVLAPITYPSNNWAYAYAYPADCLKIDELRLPELMGQPITTQTSVGPLTSSPIWQNDQKQLRHEVCAMVDANNNPTGQRAILCNVQNVILVYTRQITNPAQFPPTFVDALALKLAQRISGRLSADPSLKRELQGEYAASQAIAKRASAMETTDNGTRKSGIQRSRMGANTVY